MARPNHPCARWPESVSERPERRRFFYCTLFANNGCEASPMGSNQDMVLPVETVQQTDADDSCGLNAVQLSPLLEWLDRLLARAAAQAETLYGAQAVADPYRGLYVNYAEVNRLLDQFAGSPVFASDNDLEWKTLQLEFDLTANRLMDKLA